MALKLLQFYLRLGPSFSTGIPVDVDSPPRQEAQRTLSLRAPESAPTFLLTRGRHEISESAAHAAVVTSRFGTARQVYDRHRPRPDPMMVASDLTDAYEDLVQRLIDSGTSATRRGEYVAAIGDYGRAVRALEPFAFASVPGTREVLMQVLGLLARVQAVHGSPRQALTTASRALGIAHQIYGEDSRESATIQADMARYHHIFGEFDEVIRLFTVAIGILERVVAEPNFILECKYNLAMVYFKMGKFTEFLTVIKPIWDTFVAQYGPESENYYRMLYCTGVALYNTGDRASGYGCVVRATGCESSDVNFRIEALMNRALMTLQFRGDTTASLADIDQVLAMPECQGLPRAQVLLFYVQVNLALGNWERSAQVLVDIKRLEPNIDHPSHPLHSLFDSVVQLQIVATVRIVPS